MNGKSVQVFLWSIALGPFALIPPLTMPYSPDRMLTVIKRVVSLIIRLENNGWISVMVSHIIFISKAFVVRGSAFFWQNHYMSRITI